MAATSPGSVPRALYLVLLTSWLGEVVPVLKLWILSNAIYRDLPHHPIAAGDLTGKTCERHKSVHEVRIHGSPDPGVHCSMR